MNENKCTALIKRETDYVEGEIVPQTWLERLDSFAQRKRQELQNALGRSDVKEPISMTAILTSLAISAATTTASYFLNRAFAPKPKPIERGRTTGQLVISSQLGVMLLPTCGTSR